MPYRSLHEGLASTAPSDAEVEARYRAFLNQMSPEAQQYAPGYDQVDAYASDNSGPGYSWGAPPAPAATEPTA